MQTAEIQDLNEGVRLVDDLEVVDASEVETEFSVVVQYTDVDGQDYLKIEAQRLFKHPAEVNAWLHACAARLTHELFKLAERDDDV